MKTVISCISFQYKRSNLHVYWVNSINHLAAIHKIKFYFTKYKLLTKLTGADLLM